MDVISLLLIGCSALGGVIGLVGVVWVSSLNVNVDAYIGVMVKLLRANNIDRARKLSAVAGSAPVPRMVDAMLQVAEQPYDNEEIIQLALKDAFDSARAAELSRFALALPMLGFALVLVGVPAAIAVVAHLPSAQALLVMALIGGTLAMVAIRAIVKIRGATFERMAPIAHALASMMTNRPR
jgi:hypothetical protein